MTMAEFTAVVDKRVAWRVLFKVSVAIIGGCATLITIAFGPVLWVYGNTTSNSKDVARLDETVKGLITTTGTLQLQVASMGAEVKVMKSEQSRGFERIERVQDRIEKLLDPPIPRPAPRPRQAAVPRAAQTQ